MLLTTVASNTIHGTIQSETPVNTVEILINGQVADSFDLEPKQIPVDTSPSPPQSETVDLATQAEEQQAKRTTSSANPRAERSKTRGGSWIASFRRPLSLDGTAWVAARCYESRPDGRQRFAHTAPVWFEDPSQPLRPRREQCDFLTQRVRDELARSASLLPPEAVEEYQAALRKLEALEAAP
jgi:hypothetical protein